MNRSAIEHASFSRGSTPVPSPNPPFLPNERDDVGLRRFMIDWCSSSISQRDTITGGRPDRTTYLTLYQVMHPFTGDKGPNTHWVHGENIEITVNM